ncbi:helicase-related protein [Roseivivax sp. CAU 1761]
MALPATADPVTQADILKSLDMEEAVPVQSSFSRENLSVEIQHVEGNAFAELQDFPRKKNHGCGIVYCGSCRDVDATVLKLTRAGGNAVGYNAGMSQDDRSRAQERFLEEEEIIVVATIAFRMGIDRGDVRFVAHLDPPATLEGYYQEIGRAGRDGKPSDAIMLVTQKALGKQRQKIESVTALVETPGCRMSPLLAYFGETNSPPCGKCNHCRKPPLTQDARKQAELIFKAIHETSERYGTSTLSRVLSPGPGQADSCETRSLECYGSGRSLSKKVG